MKRRLKEAFRLQQNDIPGHYDVWFVMRKGFDHDSSLAAVESFQTLLNGYLAQAAVNPGGAKPR